MIDDFRGVNRWLSNFHYVDVEWGGLRYRSTEHAYQAAKTMIVEERMAILACITCGDAKRLGAKVTLRSNWDFLKISVMEYLLRQKFSPGSDLAAQLVATGDEELIEGNTWGDRFWGVCGGEGRNELGKLLMKIRADLRAIS